MTREDIRYNLIEVKDSVKVRTVIGDGFNNMTEREVGKWVTITDDDGNLIKKPSEWTRIWYERAN